MRYLYIILSIGLLAGCNQKSPKRDEEKPVRTAYNNTENKRDSLSVTIARNDTLNPSDSLYGVGDDDLFTASEPEFYKIKNGKWKDVSDLINDYDLTTSMDGQLSHSQPDTFSIIVTFSGLAHDPGADTAGIINSITIFNGKRQNLSSWEKSGKAKNIEVWHNSTLQGYAKLINTYKYQSVDLKDPVPLLSRKPDTFSIIIQSCYSVKQQENNKYSISEIKLDGERKY